MPMTKTIISAQNPRIKAAARLRDRRGRQQQEKIIIDGVREIERAMEGGVEIEELFIGPGLAEQPSVKALMERLKSSSVSVVSVPVEVMRKIAFGQRTDSIVAVAREPRRDLNDVPLGETPLVAVLEEVEKPGNIGAIVRTADGAGVDAVLVVGGTDIYNPNAIRASLGTVFTLPVIATTAEEALAWMRRNRLKIYAARVDGSMDYSAADYRDRCAIVLGCETDGLSKEWVGDDIHSITLPMHGKGDSLNVSVTAAVLLYEARRQRSQA